MSPGSIVTNRVVLDLRFFFSPSPSTQLSIERRILLLPGTGRGVLIIASHLLGVGIWELSFSKNFIENKITVLDGFHSDEILFIFHETLLFYLY